MGQPEIIIVNRQKFMTNFTSTGLPLVEFTNKFTPMNIPTKCDEEEAPMPRNYSISKYNPNSFV